MSVISTTSSNAKHSYSSYQSNIYIYIQTQIINYTQHISVVKTLGRSSTWRAARGVLTRALIRTEACWLFLALLDTNTREPSTPLLRLWRDPKLGFANELCIDLVAAIKINNNFYSEKWSQSSENEWCLYVYVYVYI